MLLKLIITNVRSIHSMNHNRKVIQKVINDKVKIGPGLVAGSLQSLETSILTNHTIIQLHVQLKFQKGEDTE